MPRLVLSRGLRENVTEVPVAGEVEDAADVEQVVAAAVVEL